MILPKIIHKSHIKQLVCPWRADRFFNHGHELADNEPMRLGREVHKLCAQVRLGQKTATEAYQAASCQEAADLVWAVVGKDKWGHLCSK